MITRDNNSILNGLFKELYGDHFLKSTDPFMYELEEVTLDSLKELFNLGLEVLKTVK